MRTLLKTISLWHLHVSNMPVPPIFKGREFWSQVGINYQASTIPQQCPKHHEERNKPMLDARSLMFRKAHANPLMKPPMDTKTVKSESLPL